MMIAMDFDLLKRLVEAPGVSGQEDKVREIVIDALCGPGFERETDPLGNLVIHVPGSGPKVLLDAHMDEVGFLVQSVDLATGFIRFVTAGGVDPRVAYGQPVLVWGREPLRGAIGAVPPHLISGKNGDMDRVPPVEDLFIDTGLPAERICACVSPGDQITFLSNWHLDPDAVHGKALDDRIGLFVMIEAALRASRDVACDLYLAASVQEEAGLRGAGPLTRRIRPDIAIAIEGTVANDLPGVPHHKTLARLGEGPEIRLSDGRFIADRAISSFLVRCAQDAGIPHQVVVKKVGGTNAAAYQVEGTGARATALSVPVRYIHSPVSVARRADIENTVTLLVEFLRRVREFTPC